jgi:hypothetical protein
MNHYAYLDRDIDFNLDRLDRFEPSVVIVDGVGAFAPEHLDDVIQALTTLRDRMNQGQDVTQIAMHLLAGWPELPTLREVEGAA